ncbi:MULTISPECIES: class I SAM-dependent methyltransferase [unclassified Polynucleobacter]|uniref:class I SAM-dependent methyltransferase n=1 Tax=unclassified Polynucleobacter TaxID=2640945 RepID=UPI0008BF7AD6|nr:MULTISPECIES: class I SAM-dependent methyltransferase [unclassified Polynucleobacter]OHC09841.1 MAG: methyltransferase type 11 [Polynucleobacter sp. GWA2_45_21]HBK42803.1 methyltransferase type 11 [Polynucleobacter sp.]
MGKEIDLLANYPKAKRDVASRGQEKTELDRSIARQFGEEFFDGDRSTGYGGFSYSPRFWQPVIPTFQQHWSLTSNSSVLDVGCAKGFMMHDLSELIPGINVRGVDVSGYAIENAMADMKPFVEVANATNLPFENNSFDVVISINTIHNLDRDDCLKALQEIERVSRLGAFITVDAYRNEEEKERMYAWNLTAKTIMSVDEWIKFFKEAGYTGDYYWFIP